MDRFTRHPDVAIILGYGFFRSVSMSCYLTAMHMTDQPFVFVSDMVFNLAANLITMVAAVCVMVLAYRRHVQGLNMPVAVLALLWSICLALAPTGLLNVLGPHFSLLLLALVYGMGSMMMALAYVQVMAYRKPSKVMSYIAFSALLSIALAWLLRITGTVPGVILSIAFMVASVVCLRLAQHAVSGRAAGRNANRPGFWAFMLHTPVLPHPESIASESVAAGNLAAVADAGDTGCVGVADGANGARRLIRIPLRERYREAFFTIGDTLIATCILQAVVGLLNTFMLGGEHFFTDSEWVTSLSSAIAAVIFVAFALVPLKTPSTSTLFKRLFMILPLLLMLLPFLDTQFGKTVNIVLLVGYDSVLFLATYTIITTAHSSGLSSHVLMGAFMGSMRLCLLASLLLGYWFGEGSQGEDDTRYILIVFIAIYLLSMALVFFSRSRKGAEHKSESQQQEAAVGAVAEDSFVQTCEDIANRFGITCREKEVLAYLGRGRSSGYIGKALVLSPNTVRAHIRSIYSKLDVHSRQELIDLFGTDVEVR
ncbi:MAG: helix-turn-helix transcriptional regulator [Coriobacteriales bacterium]|nr:helix-turn-helix transcriptional regulator [Coriobacteriales bacterium]